MTVKRDSIRPTEGYQRKKQSFGKSQGKVARNSAKKSSRSEELEAQELRESTSPNSEGKGSRPIETHRRLFHVQLQHLVAILLWEDPLSMATWM